MCAFGKKEDKGIIYAAYIVIDMLMLGCFSYYADLTRFGNFHR